MNHLLIYLATRIGILYFLNQFNNNLALAYICYLAYETYGMIQEYYYLKEQQKQELEKVKEFLNRYKQKDEE